MGRGCTSNGAGNMRVYCETGELEIKFSIDVEDSELGIDTRLGNKRSFGYISKGTEFSPHPDKLALVAILNLLPFAKGELQIMWGISKRFQKACNSVTRVKIHSNYENISHSSTIKGGAALSFSGGADSTAALAVMPKTTECVFLLRSENPGRTLYDSDAAMESCRRLNSLGYQVHIVESDFEYLRNPIGFPTDLAVGTPAILLCDSRNFGSIAFGTILESAFGTSGKAYRDYRSSGHFRLWSALFEAAGIGYSLPVAGVSEVGSSLICERHAIGNVHQSCIRGKWGRPCEKCWKCFRKSALLAAIRGSTDGVDYIRKIGASKEVRRKVVEDRPIKHEGVLTYAFERIKYLESEAFELFRDLIRVGEIQTKWMERWYSGSSDLICNSYRDEVVENLERILGRMSDDQESHLKGWENESDSERDEKLARFCKSAGFLD